MAARMKCIVVLTLGAAALSALTLPACDQEPASTSIATSPRANPSGLTKPWTPNETDFLWPSESRTKETWLNFSHILVSHREATFSSSPFWLPGAVPKRMREDARSRAIEYRARVLRQ